MIGAVIPTRYDPPELAVLLRVLEADGVCVQLLHSDDYRHRIHHMWNVGCHNARRAGATEIFVVNHDVSLLRGAVPMLAAALRSDPTVGAVYPDLRAPWKLPASVTLQPTHGTIGAGAMTGFAFMFRAELRLPPFDEGYNWWYGDDAFEESVWAAGYKVCRAVGVPIRDFAPPAAAKRWWELLPQIEQDRKRWNRLHGIAEPTPLPTNPEPPTGSKPWLIPASPAGRSYR